ncbi:MAG TPA: hypothetical protein VF269_06670 [Rhodanobacteraceae bacterium]
MDKAALHNAPSLETSKAPERASWLIGKTSVSIKPAGGTVVHKAGVKDGIDLKNQPPGATAVEHSHIDGSTPGVSSDGFVSPGDAQPLIHGLINYVVSKGRVAKYEIVKGRIQITVLKGRFTSHERNYLLKSINRQQNAVDEMRPSE